MDDTVLFLSAYNSTQYKATNWFLRKLRNVIPHKKKQMQSLLEKHHLSFVATDETITSVDGKMEVTAQYDYSPITRRAVKTDEYTRKIKDISKPITRYVLSNVSLVCSGSVILSHKDTVMNSMLKRIAANVKIIFRAVPNFFNSSLIRCAILFSLLCELKEIIFQSVLFTP